MMVRLLQALVRLYQITLSPFLGNQCRFTPTCSAYSHEALEKHGVLKGLILTVFRLGRCHPWGGSTWTDPVPDQFAWSTLFRYKRRDAACTCRQPHP